MLDSDQKRIVVSYDSYEKLLNREEHIENLLKNNIEYKDEFSITDKYHSFDKHKYYINFTLTPKYRA